MLLNVLLLALCSSSSALMVGVARSPPLSVTSVGAPTRASALVMKRTAEERDVLELEGTVLESMRGANFRVQLHDTDQVTRPFPPRTPVRSLLVPTHDSWL